MISIAVMLLLMSACSDMQNMDFILREKKLKEKKQQALPLIQKYPLYSGILSFNWFYKPRSNLISYCHVSWLNLIKWLMKWRFRHYKPSETVIKMNHYVRMVRYLIEEAAVSMVTVDQHPSTSRFFSLKLCLLFYTMEL